MLSFLQRHASSVIGTLCGWDRIRFRGTLRMLANQCGCNLFLRYSKVLLKDFGTFAERISKQVRNQSLQLTESLNRPLEHLASPSVCKEDVARGHLERSPVKEGLICTLTALEPCGSYNVVSNKQ